MIATSFSHNHSAISAHKHIHQRLSCKAGLPPAFNAAIMNVPLCSMNTWMLNPLIINWCLRLSIDAMRPNVPSAHDFKIILLLGYAVLTRIFLCTSGINCLKRLRSHLLTLLRGSHINPKLSAWAQDNGIYNTTVILWHLLIVGFLITMLNPRLV
jgi:hypothetical protein